jgi:hypothetical protein
MDVYTFFTVLKGVIADWYKTHMVGQIHKHAGAQAALSDSKLLTIRIAGQWSAGVAWQSERGLVRWLEVHGRGWFPRLLKRSAFNRRTRWRWRASIALQQWLAELFEYRTSLKASGALLLIEVAV